MRKRLQSSRISDDEPIINLTPLIDVVFVILIMFIVVAPILELDRVELADANDSSDIVSAKEQSLIAIHVNEDNSIWINKEFITLKDLEPKLSQTKKRYPKAKPQVFHDKRAAFGTYQSLKNALEKVGYHEMDIVLKPAP